MKIEYVENETKVDFLLISLTNRDFSKQELPNIKQQTKVCWRHYPTGLHISSIKLILLDKARSDTAGVQVLEI